MTLGDLFAYIFFTGLMAAPIIQIASIGTQITEAFAGLDRIHEILSTPREDAEDAMHDTVLGILENGAGVIENPRAYMARGTANRLVSRYRHDRVLDMIPLHDLPESEHPATQGPEAGARFQELADALTAALETLPPKCRTIYILHRLEGRTHTEIAHDLGLSRSMIEKYMTRALLHIDAQLSHYAPY